MYSYSIIVYTLTVYSEVRNASNDAQEEETYSANEKCILQVCVLIIQKLWTLLKVAGGLFFGRPGRHYVFSPRNETFMSLRLL